MNPACLILILILILPITAKRATLQSKIKTLTNVTALVERKHKAIRNELTKEQVGLKSRFLERIVQ